MFVALIDYGSGNLHSAEKALKKAACALDGSVRIEIVQHAQQLKEADKIVLPGVGAFGDCMSGLKSQDGLLEALNEAVTIQGKPFLGICVGMQMMFERGFEHGECEGFGWLKGQVKAIEPSAGLKIPHMGWNDLNLRKSHDVLKYIDKLETLDAYFVHSYCAQNTNDKDVLATTNYGHDLCAMVCKNNMVGTQFHPEKSQKLGLALLEGFLEWAP